MRGWRRTDGRIGIRNTVVVAYLVECAHHVAREIVTPFRDRDVHLIGFPGCYPNQYAYKVMSQLVTHPNVGAVLLISLGCESFDRRGLLEAARASGRPAELLVIQADGGTKQTIAQGRQWVERTRAVLDAETPVPMDVSELIVGTICGGSDATSGLTANPAMGRAFDHLIGAGGIGIFEETGELIGCEHIMAERARTPELAAEIVGSVEKAVRYYTLMGHGSFAPDNAEGGLTTQEEKSMGAYAKSGSRPIDGLIKPGDVPSTSGLYLLDVVPDGEPRFGFPNISDNAEIVELIACGSHLILFSTGRGSVVGSAISPVIKVCANPDTFRRLPDDMDIDAGAILEGRASLEEVGHEIYQRMLEVASGARTASEGLGHQEFILTYKSFDPIGPGCMPSGGLAGQEARAPA